MIVFPGRGHINGMVEPAIPARRNTGGFCNAVIDDPAFVCGRIMVICVAELIMADQFTFAPRIKTGPHGLAVPPGEHLYEKVLHVSSQAPDFCGINCLYDTGISNGPELNVFINTLLTTI